jgi:abortive infection bacteriophage resistance protein
MAAIERIEVAIFRTQLVELNTTLYGPFGYTKQKNYNPKISTDEFQKLLHDINDNESRSHEEFIRRYRAKYSAEQHLPLWMAAELMSFGQLLTLYRNQHLAVKQTISHRYNLFPMVLDSWLLTLGALRNSCAHHSRIWNRPLPMPTRLPDRKYDPRWYSPHTVHEKSLYLALSFINHLLTYIAPVDQWKQSVIGLLSAYPDIPLAPMGIPTDWQGSPLWS